MTNCARCGRKLDCLEGSVTTPSGEVAYLCHGGVPDQFSCYHIVTVYGGRYRLPRQGMDADARHRTRDTVESYVGDTREPAGSTSQTGSIPLPGTHLSECATVMFPDSDLGCTCLDWYPE